MMFVNVFIDFQGILRVVYIVFLIVLAILGLNLIIKLIKNYVIDNFKQGCVV